MASHVQKVAERMFVVSLGYVNVVLLGDREGFWLVDAGAPGTFKPLQQRLGWAGFSLDHLQGILITHAHPDHFGNLATLMAYKEVPVLAHPLEIPVLLGEERPLLPDPGGLSPGSRLVVEVLSRMPLPAAVQQVQPIEEGQVLAHVLPGLTVIHLPGHAPGQVGFWDPASRTLVGGDVMNRISGRLNLPQAPLTFDMPVAIETVKRVASLYPRGLVLGHGAPIRRGAEVALRELLERKQLL